MSAQESKKVRNSPWNKERIKDKISVQKKGKDTSLDPTRYGDWEKKGRAIDF